MARDRLAVLDGVAIKAPVRCCPTTSTALSGLQTIDGVALSAGDRVLLINQTDASENGIYTAASGAWTRADDFHLARQITQGTLVFVAEGTANAQKMYVLTTKKPRMGQALSFSQFSLG